MFHKQILAANGVKIFLVALFIFPNSASAVSDYTHVITASQGDQLFPAIYGDRVAWSDYSSGKGAVAYANLELPGLEQVTGVQGNAQVFGIYGDRIAYSSTYPNSDFDLWIYDLNANNRTRLTSWVGNEYAPSIHEDKIAYHYESAPYSGIYLYNITTGSIRDLRSYLSTKAYRPRVYGKTVVWYQQDNTDYDLYYSNLSVPTQNTGIHLIDKPGHQQNPDIYGSKVTWMDSRNGNWDVYMYDFITRQETRVTDEPEDQVDPRIYGDFVVWADRRWGNFDIYLFNISSGKEMPLTWNEAHQQSPQIWGKYVIWNDYRNGNADIYGRDLTVNITAPIHDSCFDTGNNKYKRDYIWGYNNGTFYNYSDYCLMSSSYRYCGWKANRGCNGNLPTVYSTSDCENFCLDGACSLTMPNPTPGPASTCLTPSPSATPTPSPSARASASASASATPGASTNPIPTANPSGPNPTNNNNNPGGNNPPGGLPTGQVSKRPTPKPYPGSPSPRPAVRIIEDVERDLIDLETEGVKDPETEKLILRAKEMQSAGREEEAVELANAALERTSEKKRSASGARNNLAWYVGGALILLFAGGAYYYYNSLQQKGDEMGGGGDLADSEETGTGGFESGATSESGSDGGKSPNIPLPEGKDMLKMLRDEQKSKEA